MSNHTTITTEYPIDVLDVDTWGKFWLGLTPETRKQLVAAFGRGDIRKGSTERECRELIHHYWASNLGLRW